MLRELRSVQPSASLSYSHFLDAWAYTRLQICPFFFVLLLRGQGGSGSIRSRCASSSKTFFIFFFFSIFFFLVPSPLFFPFLSPTWCRRPLLFSLSIVWRLIPAISSLEPKARSEYITLPRLLASPVLPCLEDQPGCTASSYYQTYLSLRNIVLPDGQPPTIYLLDHIEPTPSKWFTLPSPVIWTSSPFCLCRGLLLSPFRAAPNIPTSLPATRTSGLGQ